MPAPDLICQLVEQFQDNLEAYRSPKYNETQTRIEFIDKFFKALGWDVYNEQHRAAAYKDVIREETLAVEGATKAPDYAFRIGGTRKFFVEAKKPAVNIETDIHPAFQLRRYAWSAKLPLSILTDFEEFAVYDCRIKPDKDDKASTGRVELYRFHGLRRQVGRDRRHLLQGCHSEQGSFDKYAEGHEGQARARRRWMMPSWRRSNAGANCWQRTSPCATTSLSVPELNYAVQMTIDRIVFLRICEDRGIEPDDQLRNAIKQPDVYAELVPPVPAGRHPLQLRPVPLQGRKGPVQRSRMR